MYHQTYTKLSIFGHSFKEIIFFVCLIILQSLAPYTYVWVADTHVWFKFSTIEIYLLQSGVGKTDSMVGYQRTGTQGQCLNYNRGDSNHSGGVKQLHNKLQHVLLGKLMPKWPSIKTSTYLLFYCITVIQEDCSKISLYSCRIFSIRHAIQL